MKLSADVTSFVDKNRELTKMWHLRIKDASNKTLLHFATDSADRNASPRAKSVIARQMVRRTLFVCDHYVDTHL